MKSKALMIAACSGLVMAFGSALFLAQGPSEAAAAPSPKVQVCHIPPGNPSNFHTINVSGKALSAHLAHGDLAGACNFLCASLCDDGDKCTVDDAADCEEQGCPTSPEPVDCSDGLACTVDSCDSATGCINDPLVCLASDLCHVSACAEPEGVCLETEILCRDGETCNPANGLCEPTAPEACENDGSLCDEERLCNPPEIPVCQDGEPICCEPEGPSICLLDGI